MRLPTAVSLSLVLGMGCSDRVTEVPLDDLSFSYVFLVTSDETGQVRRVVDKVGLAAGGGLPALELTKDETHFFVVSLTEDALRDAVPRLDRRRIAELELKPAPDGPPDRQVYIATSKRVLTGLPEAAEVRAGRVRPGGTMPADALEALPLEASRLRSELELLVPVDAENCRRPGQTGLRPFGATAETIFEAFGTGISVTGLQWIDEDRLLVVAFDHLIVLERGEVFQRQLEGRDPLAPSSWIPLTDLLEPEPREVFSAATIAPEPSSDGRYEVLVAGGVYPDDDVDGDLPTRGWVRRFWLSAEGLAAADEPPQNFTHHLNDISFLADGRAVAGGDDGKLFVRTSTSFEEFSPAPVLAFPLRDNTTRVRATKNPSYPVVAATLGALHVYEQDLERWSSHPIEKSILLSAEPLKFLGLDVADEPNGELSIFAATQNGDLVWRSERLAPWEIPELPYPPRFLQCASATSDDRLIYERRPISDLVVQDGYVHLAHYDCTALVLLRKPTSVDDRLCLTLVPIEGQQVEHVSDGTQIRRALASRPGAVAVATLRGGVYVSEW